MRRFVARIPREDAGKVAHRLAGIVAQPRELQKRVDVIRVGGSRLTIYGNRLGALACPESRPTERQTLSS
jgi:hypothetical protein